MNILIVYGTRPEAIKLAPLVKAIKSDSEFNLKVCITGQHLELLDQVNEFFGIEPDYSLKVMSENQDLNGLASKLLMKLSSVILDSKPDLILVQGDTTTTFIAALAGFYAKIKVAHIEAGLRSFSLNEPYPEEANRLLTSRISFLHFAPTQKNVQNLLNEGINAEYIYNTGNTVVDALYLTLNLLNEGRVPEEIQALVKRMEGYERCVLITAHRRENFGIGIQNISGAIKELSKMYENILFIIPVHPNPNVKSIFNHNLQGLNNVALMSSLNYESLIFILNKSYLVLTDSGGIQEEAPSLGKPVLVLRNVTERQEAVDAGCVKLVGTDKSRIIKEFQMLVENASLYKLMQKTISPYGDGNASIYIIDAIKQRRIEILEKA